MPFWPHERGPGLLALPKEPPQFMYHSFIQQSITLCPASVPPAAAPLWPPEVSAGGALRSHCWGRREKRTCQERATPPDLVSQPKCREKGCGGGMGGPPVRGQQPWALVSSHPSKLCDPGQVASSLHLFPPVNNTRGGSDTLEGLFGNDLLRPTSWGLPGPGAQVAEMGGQRLAEEESAKGTHRGVLGHCLQHPGSLAGRGAVSGSTAHVTCPLVS